jgi:hypothetical protein
MIPDNGLASLARAGDRGGLSNMSVRASRTTSRGRRGAAAEGFDVLRYNSGARTSVIRPVFAPRRTTYRVKSSS